MHRVQIILAANSISSTVLMDRIKRTNAPLSRGTRGVIVTQHRESAEVVKHMPGFARLRAFGESMLEEMVAFKLQI